jgi:hypothetical protein
MGCSPQPHALRSASTGWRRPRLQRSLYTTSSQPLVVTQRSAVPVMDPDRSAPPCSQSPPAPDAQVGGQRFMVRERPAAEPRNRRTQTRRTSWLHSLFDGCGAPDAATVRTPETGFILAPIRWHAAPAPLGCRLANARSAAEKSARRPLAAELLGKAGPAIVRKSAGGRRHCNAQPVASADTRRREKSSLVLDLAALEPGARVSARLHRTGAGSRTA